jgi:hypothetical protein
MAAGGCTGDDKFVSVGDGMRVPGTALEDGAVADGEASGNNDEVPDGSVRLPDGAIVPAFDASADDDGGTDEQFDPVMCSVSQDAELALDVGFNVESMFALAPSIGADVGFGLAYNAEGACAKRIDGAFIDSIGAFPKARTLFEPDCNPIWDVTLLGTADGFRLAWVDNVQGRAELSALELDRLMRKPKAAVPVPLTDNDLVESNPVSALVGGVPRVAWIAKRTKTGEYSLWMAPMDGTGKPVELVAESEARRPMRLAMAEMGHGLDVTSGVVGWLEQVAEKGMWSQAVGLDGKPAGSPQLVSQLAGAGSSIDVASRQGDGGGIIYTTVIQGTVKEIRFRRLDQDGKLQDQERKIVSLPLQGADASLVRVGGGYAVAYRALPAVNSGITEPEIRITFISKEGNPQLDAKGRLVSYSMAKAALDGGRTSLRLSTDGQLVVAYVDGGSPDKLKIVRRRLDCP